MKNTLFFSFFILILTPCLWAEHWEVSVSLKNGSILSGYVLDDLFMEEFINDSWVMSQDSKYAGLRLWFVANTQGFIFLRHRDILHIERVRSFSDEELYIIQRKLEDTSNISTIPEKELPPLNQEEKISPESTENEEIVEEPFVSPEQLMVYQNLLKQYPPALWNLQYARNQIRIQAMNNIPVSFKYRDFLEKYDAWVDAQEFLTTGQLYQYSVLECEHLIKFYGSLLEKYPSEDWSLAIVGKRARSKSVQGALLPRQDLEYLANYDNWRKALRAKKALEDGSAQKETERREKQKSTLPLQKTPQEEHPKPSEEDENNEENEEEIENGEEQSDTSEED